MLIALYGLKKSIIGQYLRSVAVFIGVLTVPLTPTFFERALKDVPRSRTGEKV